jgi:F-type H+-transporting ATPase subunit b
MALLSTAFLSGGGSPIDLDGTFLIQLSLFAVAFVVLRTLVFRPMMALFDARERAIEGAQKEARSLESEGEEKVRTFEDQMRRAKVTAAEEKERLRVEGVQLERSILEQVRGETHQMLRDADDQLRREAANVRLEMRTKAPILAKEIAQKLLGREVP